MQTGILSGALLPEPVRLAAETMTGDMNDNDKRLKKEDNNFRIMYDIVFGCGLF